MRKKDVRPIGEKLAEQRARATELRRRYVEEQKIKKANRVRMPRNPHPLIREAVQAMIEGDVE